MLKFAVSAALALSVAVPALADAWDFILINNTGKPIASVEVSPTGAEKWQPNKVDEDLKREGDTKPGARITVHFEKDASCKYDVKATFSDKTTSVWSGINVCDNSYITLKYNASGATTFVAN